LFSAVRTHWEDDAALVVALVQVLADEDGVRLAEGAGVRRVGVMEKELIEWRIVERDQ